MMLFIYQITEEFCQILGIRRFHVKPKIPGEHDETQDVSNLSIKGKTPSVNENNDNSLAIPLNKDNKEDK